jgi:hypothetical protein
MEKSFLIYAPPYDPNSGGSIVLHKLCDLINRQGRSAFIYPLVPSFELNIGNLNQVSKMVSEIQASVNKGSDFDINPEFNTPVLTPTLGHRADARWIVIYPEIIFGNPLNASNIVRWMLYKPGFHVDKIYYTLNEFHVYYNKEFKFCDFPGATDCKDELRIEHYPFELYRSKMFNKDRKGLAYCARKTKINLEKFHLNSINCIDGKSHEEIANIFGRVEYFISFDQYTGYSSLASIAGCKSIIVPDPSISPGSARLIDGVAYGYADLERAENTRDGLIKKFESIEEENTKQVKNFLNSVGTHFCK